MTIRPTASAWKSQVPSPTPNMSVYQLRFESIIEEVTAYQWFDAESDIDAALRTSEIIRRRQAVNILGRHVLIDSLGNSILESPHVRNHND